MNTSSKEIHKVFLKTAKAISAELHTAIKTAGPITFEPRRDMPLSGVLCRSIVGQQLSTKAARTIWQRLVDAADKDAADSQDLLEFINNSDTETLRSCGLSANKCKAIKGIATAFLSGDITEEHMERITPEERAAILTSLWGVGQWTADMVNMFYYAAPDIWPDKDLAVAKTFQALIGETKNLNDTARLFQPHRSTLARYMWEVKDNKPVT